MALDLRTFGARMRHAFASKTSTLIAQVLVGLLLSAIAMNALARLSLER
jgi:hypothetical protein